MFIPVHEHWKILKANLILRKQKTLIMIKYNISTSLYYFVTIWLSNVYF